MDKSRVIFMASPRIGLTVTSEGVEQVLILTDGGEHLDRTAGFSLCSFLDSEIKEFDKAIKSKLNKLRRNKIGIVQ